ncbi:methionine gamma-lyase [Siminovitchia terrae]|uniref:L-methionine gamma-lyase n=1 Tax=Siminovitchia terrae TaxID=1914933 RepID=A0A429XCE5_SIMTE|nr:methionine gamma-lyase [Siminovitchia terrae]RST61012.1 methionine gamma-lyase [Siminovitchia terrae]GIN90876.1 methionine gamma-lyase [Siminovitchia terrae]GIN97651.1 methionine gamma-lyase [Siminovitchia terrae]
MVKKNRFETDVIHAGYRPADYLGSLVPPIFQTSTYTFPSAEEGERRFAGESEGHIYSRLGNPTVTALEERMTALEQGEAALAFASGMGAVSATLFHLTNTGDHILCSGGIYGCTFGLLQIMKKKYNIDHDLIDMDREEAIKAAIRDNTKVIYVETPINPTMKLVDLEMIVRIAKEHDIRVVVDNTFCSPYLQRPLSLGCDYVVHSATKYIGGHGDVVAGIVVGADKEEIAEMGVTMRKDIGGIMSPFDAWLLLRGLKTLAVRLDRHCENAEKIAEKLKAHPKVGRMFYPGDPDFPQYELAKRQMRLPGGMISFEVKGSKEEAQAILNRVKLIRLAVSLGDTETLIQHPATMTHAVVPEDERKKMGITDTLIRMSVGIEAWEDVWEDLKQALDGI